MTAGRRPAGKPRQAERRAQILLEVQIVPHVRLVDQVRRFAVTTETVRRDLDALGAEGRLARSLGGTVPAPAARPDVKIRGRDRMPERMRIGRLAADPVEPGDTIVIDADATAMEAARRLALRAIRCTVITNALHVALAIRRSPAARVILCPGDCLAREAAVVGPDSIALLDRHTVDPFLVGASAFDGDDIWEIVPGFADVKWRMLARSRTAYLLVDTSMFGRRDLDAVARAGDLTAVLTNDAPPPTGWGTAFARLADR